MTTPSLFDVEEPQPAPEAPRCRMCARAARWSRIHLDWLAYCGGGACINQRRLCQHCGAEFERGVDGAGNKYCSTDCKSHGYNAGKRYIARSYRECCAWCGEEGEKRGGGIWPYICASCQHPIKHLVKRLKMHRVPHEQARRLSNYPYCDACGVVDIVTKTKDSRTGGYSARLVVDHDHECCPGAHSCGACVRGLLCGNCNLAAGQLHHDPSKAQLLSDYLSAYKPLTRENR